MVINIEKHDCRRTTQKIVDKHSPKSGATLSESKKDWRESNTSSTIRLSWGFYGENCKEICAWRKLWRRWSFAPVNRAPSGKEIETKKKGDRKTRENYCIMHFWQNHKLKSVLCESIIQSHNQIIFSWSSTYFVLHYCSYLEQRRVGCNHFLFKIIFSHSTTTQIYAQPTHNIQLPINSTNNILT